MARKATLSAAILQRKTKEGIRLSPSYGIHTAREAHDWFLEMMAEHEEFELETDRAGEWPVPFSSDTVRWMEVE